MRPLIVMVLLAQLAGVARADLYDRGRAKQKAGIALLVVGTAVLVAAGPLILVGEIRGGTNCTALVGDYCGPTLPYYLGVGFAVGGAVMHAVGAPLYVSGSIDVDRFRNGPPPSMPLATVRF